MCNAGLIGVFWLWVGLILGISVIATPAKFLADTLDIRTALDVGRHTFSIFNKIEWLLLSFVLIFAVITKLSRFKAILVFVLFCVLLIQTLWLLPELVMRVEGVMMGNVLMKSFHHTAYAMLEALKLSIAITFAIMSTVLVYRGMH